MSIGRVPNSGIQRYIDELFNLAAKVIGVRPPLHCTDHEVIISVDVMSLFYGRALSCSYLSITSAESSPIVPTSVSGADLGGVLWMLKHPPSGKKHSSSYLQDLATSLHHKHALLTK